MRKGVGVNVATSPLATALVKAQSSPEDKWRVGHPPLRPLRRQSTVDPTTNQGFDSAILLLQRPAAEGVVFVRQTWRSAYELLERIHQRQDRWSSSLR